MPFFNKSLNSLKAHVNKNRVARIKSHIQESHFSFSSWAGDYREDCSFLLEK